MVLYLLFYALIKAKDIIIHVLKTIVFTTASYKKNMYGNYIAQ